MWQELEEKMRLWDDRGRQVWLQNEPNKVEMSEE
jgi:hypothetical protein